MGIFTNVRHLLAKEPICHRYSELFSESLQIPYRAANLQEAHVFLYLSTATRMEVS